MIGEHARQRTEPTPLPAGRDALTRRRRIRGRPATDPRSGQRRRVAVRGAARRRRWGARGVARFAGSPTSGQSAPRAAAAPRSCQEQVGLNAGKVVPPLQIEGLEGSKSPNPTLRQVIRTRLWHQSNGSRCASGHATATHLLESREHIFADLRDDVHLRTDDFRDVVPHRSSHHNGGFTVRQLVLAPQPVQEPYRCELKRVALH